MGLFILFRSIFKSSKQQTETESISDKSISLRNGQLKPSGVGNVKIKKLTSSHFGGVRCPRTAKEFNIHET